MMHNHCYVHGRLCRDPEMHRLQDGTVLCNFTLACQMGTNRVLFQRCTAWRGIAEWMEAYFVKGMELLVDGELATESWTDKTGQRREQNVLTVNHADFCGPAPASPGDLPETDLPWREEALP